MANLDVKHLDDLRGSGLRDETIAAAGIDSADSNAVRNVLRWKPADRDWQRGMIFPYRSFDGGLIAYARVKLDHPRVLDGNPIKYESPSGLASRAYFPRGFAAAFARAQRVLVTEGEKKALAAMQAGFTCIGLPGVWSWQRRRARNGNGNAVGPRTLLPDLARLNWKGRAVYIAFDSDATDNPQIRLAETELAKALEAQGAIVHVIRFAHRHGGGKTGLDDFLVTHGENGPRELQHLIDTAPFWALNAIAETDRPNDLDVASAYLHDQFHHADGPTLRYWRSEFWRWADTHFRGVSGDDLHKRLLSWTRGRIAKPTTQRARDVRDAVASMVQILEHHNQPLWLGNEPAEEHRDWLAMRNGLLDLTAFIAGRNDVLRPHSPLWFSPTALSYPFDPAAACPNWLQFLNDVFEGDTERISLLAEWFGYCLSADTSMQAIMLMEGPRRSGKGTTLRVLRKLVGEDNCVDPRLSTLDTTFGLWGLLGKSVAICSDVHLPAGNKALSVLEILKAISGEDAIEVHCKHLPSISCRLPIRFTLAVNELPKFADASNALAARLRILPFRKSFAGHEDRGLEARLTAEVQGIFLWAIEGLRRLRQTGRFTVPEISRSAAEDFARLASPVQAFVDDCCVVGTGLEVEANELRAAWNSWCRAEGGEPGSAADFGRQLRAVVPGLGRARLRRGAARPWVYRGIALRPSDDPGPAVWAVLGPHTAREGKSEADLLAIGEHS